MNVSWAILQIGLGDLFNDWNDGIASGFKARMQIEEGDEPSDSNL